MPGKPCDCSLLCWIPTGYFRRRPKRQECYIIYSGDWDFNLGQEVNAKQRRREFKNKVRSNGSDKTSYRHPTNLCAGQLWQKKFNHLIRRGPKHGMIINGPGIIFESPISQMTADS